MHANELLNKLDRVTGAPDKRRLCATIANDLRAAVGLQRRIDRVNRDITMLQSKFATRPNQYGVQDKMRMAELCRERDRLNALSPKLIPTMKRAENALQDWDGY